jgi:hypothetical protein
LNPVPRHRISAGQNQSGPCRNPIADADIQINCEAIRFAFALVAEKIIARTFEIC